MAFSEPPRIPTQSGQWDCTVCKKASRRAFAGISPGGKGSCSRSHPGNSSHGSAVTGLPSIHRFRHAARAVQLGASPTGIIDSSGRPTLPAQIRQMSSISGKSSSQARHKLFLDAYQTKGFDPAPPAEEGRDARLTSRWLVHETSP